MSRGVVSPSNGADAFGEPRGCKSENNAATAQLSCDCRAGFIYALNNSCCKCNRDRNALRTGKRDRKIIRSVQPDAERSGNDIPVVCR